MNLGGYQQRISWEYEVSESEQELEGKQVDKRTPKVCWRTVALNFEACRWLNYQANLRYLKYKDSKCAT